MASKLSSVRRRPCQRPTLDGVGGCLETVPPLPATRRELIALEQTAGTQILGRNGDLVGAQPRVVL